MDINLYKPEHPLPSEIQQMSNDDTVCQYCGVSYLIHNEMKKMQEKLEEYRLEVERLHHFDERENQLMEELNVLKNQSSGLKQKLKQEVERGQRQNENITEKQAEIENYILERKMHLSKIEDVQEENKIYKSKILVYGKNIRSLQMDINDINRNFKDMVSAYNLIIKTTVNKVIEKASTLDLEHTARFNEIQEMVNKLTCELTETKASQAKVLQDLKSNYTNQLNEMKSLHAKEISDAQKKQQVLSNEKGRSIEELMECKRKNELLTGEIEKEKGEQQQKNERNRELISQLQEKVRSKEEQMNILKSSDNNDRKVEMSILMGSILKLEEDNKKLELERESMITAHQYRIEQLQSSYREKLEQAERWPGKHENAMREMEQQFKEETENVRNEALKDYNSKLIEITKENDTIVKVLKEDFNVKERKFRQVMDNLQNKFENDYRNLQNELEQTKGSSDKEMDALNKIISRLKIKLEEKETALSNNGQADLTNKRMMELENVVETMQAELQRKDSLCSQHQKEVEMLRDCVRRECEERYDLTEALAEARTELLSLQRFQDVKRTKSNHIPAPPSVTRKTPNSDSPGEAKLNNTSITLKDFSIRNRTTLDNIHSSAGSEQGSIGSKEWFHAAVGKHSRNKLKLSFRNHRT